MLAPRPSVCCSFADSDDTRSICPGRYFAAYIIKATLAHIILEYDLKLGGDGVRPADVYFGTSVLPAMDGRVLFRKRGKSLGVRL